MERNAVVICSVVGFLGLLSAAAGFAAEATRIKGSSMQLIAPTQCAYPRNPALALGVIAVASLVIAQVIINVATGWTWGYKSSHLSSTKWIMALGCFCISWFTFAVAFFLLLTATAMNERHGEDSSDFGNYYCYVVKPGVFAGGAALSILSVTLGMLYYLTLTSPLDNSDATSFRHQGTSAASARPQLPARDPVFVHEDTYLRRQFT